MTNDEAITILSAYLTCLKCGISGKPCDVNCKTQYEAGTMGEIVVAISTVISALKAQSDKDINALGKDTVYRQDAIDAMLNLNVEHRVSWLDAVIDTLDDLPSAEPEKRTNKRTKTHECDLPSAEPDIIHLQKEQAYMQGWEDGRKNLMEQLPSAEPKRPTGRWIDTGSGQECSECHEIQYGYDSGRFYCPNCGAKMEV